MTSGSAVEGSTGAGVGTDVSCAGGVVPWGGLTGWVSSRLRNGGNHPGVFLSLLESKVTADPVGPNVLESKTTGVSWCHVGRSPSPEAEGPGDAELAGKTGGGAFGGLGSTGGARLG